MSSRNKKRLSPLWSGIIILLALANLAMLISYFIEGKNVALFNPKGLIASDQHSLTVYTMIVLLAVVIPTLFVAFFIAWRYRDTNSRSVKAATPSRTKHLLLGMGIWTIPLTVLVILASVMLPATHKLAPQKSIAAEVKPLKIQVISLRWKWVFLYPEQGIATVNYLQLPVDTPVEFQLTADDAPMSSFWVPNLGGQLYTMTGMVNKLNLMGKQIGEFPGSSAEINGAGFADMKFKTRVSSSESFDLWVNEVKRSPTVLDDETYDDLVQPSQNNPVALYSKYETGLYDTVVMKYLGHGGHSH